MAHSLSLPDDLYQKIKEEAATTCRSIPMQIKYAMRIVEAYQLSRDNDWLNIPTALQIIESSENPAEILIGNTSEEIHAFFKTLG
jgi:hypothetical protein